MSIYTITSPISRFDIIKPKMPLHQWLAKQTDKPDILLNASLYSNINTGIGTFYEAGKLTQNEGKGWGVGNIVGDLGNIQFGQPFDGPQWYDYLTGYYGLIQNGKKIDPPWADAYVFGKKNKRIAIGKNKHGQICVATGASMDIKAFRDYGYSNGLTEMVNLDGGGSVSLYWQGKQVSQSSRTPYNAIAIWLKHEDKEDDKPMADTIKVKCLRKTLVYDAAGKVQVGRYIAAGDVCQLKLEVEPKTLEVAVQYPAGSTKRWAYTKDLGNFKAV